MARNDHIDLGAVGKKGEQQKVKATVSLDLRPREIVVAGVAKILTVFIDDENLPAPRIEGDRAKVSSWGNWPAKSEITIEIEFFADGEWDATIYGDPL